MLTLIFILLYTVILRCFYRRFVWNFFRLENEHLNNCGRFRAVRDISVAPIDSSDQTHILRLMDEPLTPHDLNRNRRNKVTGGGIGKKIPNLTFQPSRSVDEQASLILASLGTRWSEILSIFCSENT